MHKFEIATVLLLQAINLVSAKSARVQIAPDVTNQLGKGVSGTVTFTQQNQFQQMLIQVFISGLTPGSIHGMHIHGSAVTGQNCTLASSHWNPMNATHGAPQNPVDKRHYGDLGNFQANAQGIVSRVFTDHILSFTGSFPISNNLALVFHEKQDDLGLGQGDKAAESSKTGNCGSRLACGNFVLDGGSNYGGSTILTSSTTATPSTTSTSATLSTTTSATLSTTTSDTLSTTSTSNTLSTTSSGTPSITSTTTSTQPTSSTISTSSSTYAPPITITSTSIYTQTDSSTSVYISSTTYIYSATAVTNQPTQPSQQASYSVLVNAADQLAPTFVYFVGALVFDLIF